MKTRRFAMAVAAIPLLAACSDFVENESLAPRPVPSGGSQFVTYAAIGTSIAAGIQSGGINDSTQRDAYTYRLAQAMGLTPGVDWIYPSFRGAGCPGPFTNPLTNQRVGGGSATFCGFRTATPPVNNTGIPFLRAAQALDVTVVPFPTDTLKLAQFITGSVSPVSAVMRLQPTFVTIEVGANDVLHAATRGDTTLLTTAASFSASLTSIADSMGALASGPNVAIASVPNVTLIPHLSRGLMFYCLRFGCPGIPATPPYSGATFIPNANCAPNAVIAGSKGDSSFVAFPTTAGITQVLAGGGAATLDCVTGAVTINVGAGFVAPPFSVFILTPAEYVTVVARVTALNTAIQTLATARNWAFVDLNAALAANAAQIPPFPSFATPTTTLFGTLFSLDGVHPTRAGQRILAQAFVTQINSTFGSTLPAIP